MDVMIGYAKNQYEEGVGFITYQCFSMVDLDKNTSVTETDIREYIADKYGYEVNAMETADIRALADAIYKNFEGISGAYPPGDSEKLKNDNGFLASFLPRDMITMGIIPPFQNTVT